MAGKTPELPSLYDLDTCRAVVERIGRLSQDATPAWGSMTVGRMLAHCADAQDVLNGEPLEGTPWWMRMAAGVVKRLVLSGRPFPRGLPTHPQYLETDERSFGDQRERLLRAIADFRAGDGGLDHDLFGPMSADEVGWLAYKHLDHHLRQFGV